MRHIPLLHANDWPALCGNDPLFGGFALSQRGRTRRVLMSPGPVFHHDVGGKDWWGAARVLFAAGMRPGDVVLNCFSYHLSPFGFLMDLARRRWAAPSSPPARTTPSRSPT